MTDRIEPVLSAEQWSDLPSLGYFDWDCGIVDVSYQDADYQNLPAKLIAVANDALKDDDKRKITREWVAELRELVELLRSGDDITRIAARTALLAHLADALASYLPPE